MVAAIPDDAPQGVPIRLEDGVRFYAADDVMRLAPADYLRWVEDPRTPRVDEVRLYGASRRWNRLLNHWPWWLPLVVWPPVPWLLLRDASPHRLAWTALAIALFFPLEVLAHRYVFHPRVQTRALQRVHLTMHGGHHLAPNDAGRLSMHPLMVAAVCALVWAVVGLVPGADPRGFVAGVLLQYLRYDATHCAVHLWDERTLARVPLLGGFLAACKRNHMRHHFANPRGHWPISFVLPSRRGASPVSTADTRLRR